jgi:hypothetical protein
MFFRGFGLRRVMKISNEAMVATYEVAKRIRDATLSRAAGIEELHQRFALNRSSAGDTITNIGYMLKGKRYVRTNNAFATDHFLEMIHRDYGLDALRKAVSSVEKHIEYYERLPTGNKLPNIWQIVRKYRVVANGAMESLPDDEADQTGSTDGADYLPSGKDRREIVDRQIRERRGQQQFRDALRKRYGDHCLVTGCDVLSVLEAAHISPYRGEDDNHPTNGLLLRADIHTLFDLDLLGIEPEELRVELHPAVVNEYGSLVGEALRCPRNRRPAMSALSVRYEQFRQRRRTKRWT